MKKIYEVLEGVYSNDSLRRTIVPLFVGNPGIGKTVIIDKFAKDKGVKIVELITSQMSPFEISGIAMNPVFILEKKIINKHFVYSIY